MLDATGWDNGPLTANEEIANLESMLLADGVVNLSDGTPSSQDTTLLDNAATELGGGSTNSNYWGGNKLANDASQFVSDEQSFNPDGPVDASYGVALQADIRALLKDCPKAVPLGIEQVSK